MRSAAGGAEEDSCRGRTGGRRGPPAVRTTPTLAAISPLVATLALVAALPSPGGIVAADASAPAADTSDPARWVEREARVMGTRLRIRVAADSREEGFRAAGGALAAVEAAEDRWSSWREDTELARLNDAEPGVPVSLSSRMLSELSVLETWGARTGGAFDPAVGALVEAWDLRGDGREPTPGELRTALEATGLRHFRMDGGEGAATRLREDAWIDAGAFGKGLALGRARDRLRGDGMGSALLDFGGQLVAWGPGPEDGSCWRVGVADPRERHEPVARLRLCDTSAATTSGSERFVVVEGRERAHVLDPRSGRPAPAWGSVTVVHPDPMTADILSTALFVMGPEAGLRWARDRGIAALFLEIAEESLTLSATSSMEPLLMERAPAGAGEGRSVGAGGQMAPALRYDETTRSITWKGTEELDL